MPFAKFHVAPSVWSWVLKYGSSALPPRLLSDIHTWSTSRQSPDIHQIQVIGKMTDIGFGLFFGSKPFEDLYDIHFNNLKSTSNIPQNVCHLLFHLGMKAEWLNWYDTVHPWMVSPFDDLNLALLLYKNSISFNHLRRAINDYGVMTFFYSHLPNNQSYSYFNPYKFKGCTIIYHKCRIICINKNCTAYDQLKALLTGLLAVQDHRQIYIKNYSSPYTHRIVNRIKRYLQCVNYGIRPLNDSDELPDRNFVSSVDDWLDRTLDFDRAYDLLDVNNSNEFKLLNNKLNIKLPKMLD